MSAALLLRVYPIKNIFYLFSCLDEAKTFVSEDEFLIEQNEAFDEKIFPDWINGGFGGSNDSY